MGPSEVLEVGESCCDEAGRSVLARALKFEADASPSTNGNGWVKWKRFQSEDMSYERPVVLQPKRFQQLKRYVTQQLDYILFCSVMNSQDLSNYVIRPSPSYYATCFTGNTFCWHNTCRREEYAAMSVVAEPKASKAKNAKRRNDGKRDNNATTTTNNQQQTSTKKT